ncbi:hypothetical protein [Brevundimonas sp. NIBR11]|uniref:hypothetical protein n=1 Tax=Brevundimonas sp. NIBR11 TaxID=3015999 RepID=UPI0022F141E1|nr:hypothetical protein [Brevundimonas sp. NIBR11]WGM31897.1 hypothetical protein KKHFBJBL_02147 [Brevundimonas sp. NIBR11]
MANPTEIRSSDIPWRILVWGGLAALLCVPLVAMRFTDEVDWSPFDFLIVGGLFAVVGGCAELALRLSRNWTYRVGFAVAVVTGFLTLWVNMAVGMIGGEQNPANLVFLGVLLVAVVGAIVGRFRPNGMALTMVGTAVAQAWAAFYAVTLGESRDAVFIAGFCVLWLAAAGLFRLSRPRAV